jgi:hypothetical protein
MHTTADIQRIGILLHEMCVDVKAALIKNQINIRLTAAAGIAYI